MTGNIGRPIQVRVTNYDGSPHRAHPAYLVLEKDGLIVTQTFAGLEIETPRGNWVDPWDTRGYFWPDRYFTVVRLDNPHGKGLYGFYCDIATPPEFDGANLHYVDLQIDVRVYAEPGGALRYEVKDEDEFEDAVLKYGYSASLVRDAWAAVEDLRRLIEGRAFPFNV